MKSTKTAFDVEAGVAVNIAPGICRILAPNPGPFTYTGTCTYLLGEKDLTLIDPGPMSDVHLAAIEKALGGRKLRHILITHTHKDHSSLAAEVKRRLGGETFGFGPHRLARRLADDEVNALEGAGDLDFIPDHALADGEFLDLGDWQLTALHTPGHAANHLCFALHDSAWLFSGDQVMGWNTTIVAPPEGSMRDYMASLEKLLACQQEQYLPGHGDLITSAKTHVRGLANHRRQREQAILTTLAAHAATIPELVAQMYRGIDDQLKGAAGLSVLAHLEWLIEKEEVEALKKSGRTTYQIIS